MKRMLMKASPCERCFTDLILFNPTSPCHVKSMVSSSLFYKQVSGAQEGGGTCFSHMEDSVRAELCPPDPLTLESNVLPVL